MGIIAANFEWRFRTIPALKPQAGHSMEKSYEEGCKLLELMDIDDVPLYHGAKDFIENRADLPTSEGSRFIIEEAMRECEEPLYIALLENVAGQKRHIEKAPRILDDMTYAANPEGKDIYVYDDIDRRLLLDDFFARLKLCYGNE